MGGSVEVCLGTERGKGERNVGLRASRRFDNQAEWQLLVHLPSTPHSQHCHGNSSSIQGFPEHFCFQRRPLPSPCSFSPGFCLSQMGLERQFLCRAWGPPILLGPSWRHIGQREAWNDNWPARHTAEALPPWAGYCLKRDRGEQIFLSAPQ